MIVVFAFLILLIGVGLAEGEKPAHKLKSNETGNGSYDQMSATLPRPVSDIVFETNESHANLSHIRRIRNHPHLGFDGHPTNGNVLSS